MRDETYLVGPAAAAVWTLTDRLRSAFRQRDQPVAHLRYLIDLPGTVRVGSPPLTAKTPQESRARAVI
jgi:hypothetical protein